jgi:hypothetical protein
VPHHLSTYGTTPVRGSRIPVQWSPRSYTLGGPGEWNARRTIMHPRWPTIIDAGRGLRPTEMATDWACDSPSHQRGRARATPAHAGWPGAPGPALDERPLAPEGFPQPTKRECPQDPTGGVTEQEAGVGRRRYPGQKRAVGPQDGHEAPASCRPPADSVRPAGRNRRRSRGVALRAPRSGGSLGCCWSGEIRSEPGRPAPGYACPICNRSAVRL